MKQRIIVAAASLVLAALILLLLPLDPKGPQMGTNSTDPTGTGVITDPTGNVQTKPLEGCEVRLYSCDEATHTLFAELAAEYSALTGIEVEVLGSEEDGCQATLQRLMESEDPPTVLCVHSQKQLLDWQNTLLDLGGTTLAEAMSNDGLGLRVNGKLLAIPLAVEAYGLLVNAELIGTKGALSRNDIYDLSSLSTAVQILKNNSVKAFPMPNVTLMDAWYLVMGEELESTRAFLDLFIANGNKTGDAMEQFLDGKAAFRLGGSWEYDTLAAYTDRTFHVRNLDILPNFAVGAMQYVCSTAWCVNASARQEDIRATLNFLTWMVTADQGAAPVDRLQQLSPFADAAWYGNQLQKKLRGYMQTEKAVLQWKMEDASDKRLLLALTTYMAENNDDNWKVVVLTAEAIKAEQGYQ